MLLLLGILLGVIIGFAARGRLMRLTTLRGLWLPILSFAVMPALRVFPMMPLWIKAVIMVFSYGCVLAFAYQNRKFWPASLLIAGGSLMNFAVIAANAFRMPVSQRALTIYPDMTAEAVVAKHADYFVACGDNARLLFLGDVIYVPLPLVGGFLSLGDIVLALGVGLLIVLAMVEAPHKEN